MKDLTVAALLDLSAWSDRDHSVQLHPDAAKGPGAWYLNLHGVPILKAPGLAAELKRIGFAVADSLRPAGVGGGWVLGASIDVGMWHIAVFAFVDEAHAAPSSPPPPKRDPLPLSDVAELHDDSPHGDVGDVQAMP